VLTAADGHAVLARWHDRSDGQLMRGTLEFAATCSNELSLQYLQQCPAAPGRLSIMPVAASVSQIVALQQALSECRRPSFYANVC
jgi:hypothetical protein